MVPVYGDFLRSVRTSRGLSQADLAAVAGIDQPNLSAYERDRRVPTIDTLNRILVACGYQLAAVAGPAVVPCPLPRAGWFPDEDDPPALPGDPVDAPPLVTAATPLDERVALLTAVLELVEATRP